VGLVAVLIVAFAPAHDVFLAGDDFEWLEASYGILAHPLDSFETINHFFRPLVKWTFAANYLVFGDDAPGYMATNLAIHACNVLLLYLFLARRLRPVVAAAAAAVFGLSPLHSEAVLWASGRPDTLLLVSWLGSILLLDRGGSRRGRGRTAAFLIVALLGAGAKETWVLFPILGSGFLLLVERSGFWSSVRRLWVVWSALGLYLALFLVRPVLSGEASPAHYADFGLLAAVAKSSRTLLGFFGFGGAEWGAAWDVSIAVLVVLGAVIVAVRSGNRLAQWAILWMVAAIGIAAPFEFTALRHNYLPLAGFWMAAAAFTDRALSSGGGEAGRRRLVAVVAGTLAAAVLVVEGAALQLEIDDYRRYGEVHEQLCELYNEVAPDLAHDRPLVLVDYGSRRAVEEVAREVRGIQKTFFVRAEALWQLVFFGPLAEFCGGGFQMAVLPLRGEELAAAVGGPLSVVVFADGGFRVRPDLAAEICAALDRNGTLPHGARAYRFVSR